MVRSFIDISEKFSEELTFLALTMMVLFKSGFPLDEEGHLSDWRSLAGLPRYFPAFSLLDYRVWLPAQKNSPLARNFEVNGCFYRCMYGVGADDWLVVLLIPPYHHPIGWTYPFRLVARNLSEAINERIPVALLDGFTDGVRRLRFPD